MIEIGRFNKLKILRDTDPGLFLGDDEDNEVLLPNRYVPNDFEIDASIHVFVYLDNEERLVAVTDTPYIQKGDFALLRCNAIWCIFGLGPAKGTFLPIQRTSL